MQSLLFPEFSPGDLEQRALSEWTDRWLAQFPALDPGDHTLAGRSLVLRKLKTPLGPMLAMVAPSPSAGDTGQESGESRGLVLLEFVEEERIEKQLHAVTKARTAPLLHGKPGSCAELDEVENQIHGYFAGERQRFDLRLAPTGTAFQQDVWEELIKIPYGTQVSYSEIAGRINRPSATRAVGAANGRNPLTIIQPCHRVVGADGTLTGYGGGLWRKRRLIELEAQHGIAH